MLAIRQKRISEYSKKSGRSNWTIELDMERDAFMTPMEAKDYGILDLIGDEYMEQV